MACNRMDGTQTTVGERRPYSDETRPAVQELVARTAAESDSSKKLLLRFVDPATSRQTIMLEVSGTWMEPEGSSDVPYSTHHANGFRASFMLDRRVRQQATAIVTIIMDGKFDPENTAYHEAYHLARQNLTHAELDALQRAFPSEEAEAAAFAERAQTRRHRSAKGLVAQAFDTIRTPFERIGNMLHGLGYRSTGDVFDAVLVDEVGRRKAQAAAMPTSWTRPTRRIACGPPTSPWRAC